VFTPKKANGLGVIFVISGGWVSAADVIKPNVYRAFLERGYTVFAILHGSQPKYTIPEIVEDVHRAVRFIRHHAKEYRIDPDRIGITGGSSGGQLALTIATAGTKGGSKAHDPVDRESSRVQAAACFCPPSDFLNWGKPGRVLDSRRMASIPQLKLFASAVDFKIYDPERGVLVSIVDEEKVKEILRGVSPAAHVSADDPPILLVHGDKDELVPLQQSESLVAKLKEAGVPAKLIVKKDCGHVWLDLIKDMRLAAEWFDQHLKDKAKDRVKADR
jgi:acetyl esterase/lipase